MIGHSGTGTGKVTYLYTPPNRATNVQFQNATMVKGPDVSGTYTLEPGQGQYVAVTYNIDPQAPAGSLHKDALEVTDESGQRHSCVFEANVPAGGSATALEAYPAFAQEVSSAALTEAWHLEQYLYPSRPLTITQAECRDWVNFFQSDNTFLAFRVPLTRTTPTDEIPLPVIFTRPQSATVRVTGTSMQAPLEYRPARMDFAQNNLPAGTADEYWVPLGIVVSPTMSCPASGLRFEVGQNEVFFTYSPICLLRSDGCRSTCVMRARKGHQVSRRLRWHSPVQPGR